MKITISAVKANIGSIGGLAPSQRVLAAARAQLQLAKYRCKEGRALLRDYSVNQAGNGLAILMTHSRGENNLAVHELVWTAFRDAIGVAREQGLDVPNPLWGEDSFPGNIRNTGVAVAEIQIEERENESFLWIAADQTQVGAFNLPLCLAFADQRIPRRPAFSGNVSKDFRFLIRDISSLTEGRVTTLDAPEEIGKIAALLRDSDRYMVESIWSRPAGEQVVAVGGSGLLQMAGPPDAVMLVRTQRNFPAALELLEPFAIGLPAVWSPHAAKYRPLMPVPVTPAAILDEVPGVTSAAFSIHHGRLTEPIDCFAAPFWNTVRDQLARNAVGELRGLEFRFREQPTPAIPTPANEIC